MALNEKLLYTYKKKYWKWLLRQYESEYDSLFAADILIQFEYFAVLLDV